MERTRPPADGGSLRALQDEARRLGIGMPIRARDWRPISAGPGRLRTGPRLGEYRLPGGQPTARRTATRILAGRGVGEPAPSPPAYGARPWRSRRGRPQPGVRAPAAWRTARPQPGVRRRPQLAAGSPDTVRGPPTAASSAGASGCADAIEARPPVQAPAPGSRCHRAGIAPAKTAGQRVMSGCWAADRSRSPTSIKGDFPDAGVHRRRRPSPTARRRCMMSTSQWTAASSSRSSARPAAARARCYGWRPVSTARRAGGSTSPRSGSATSSRTRRCCPGVPSVGTSSCWPSWSTCPRPSGRPG